MLNAQWLETFTVLIEIGHFTRAADHLGMTQPGVSQHLRKLEEQIGQALISRQGKSFSLTAAGESVFAMGQARRAQEKALFQAVAQDDPAVGEVSVACSGSFAMALYPQIFALMRAAPGLTVRLVAAPQDDVVAGVLAGRFDLGIADHAPRHPRLDAQHLGQEELCLVVPRGYVDGEGGQSNDMQPIGVAAGKKEDTKKRQQTDDITPVTLAGLDALGFVAHPDGFAYADELFALNFPETFKGSDRLRIRSFINQISQIPAPVAKGIGYTLLPRSGIDGFADRDAIRVQALPHSRFHDLWLIQRRGRALPARMQRICAVIENTAATLAHGRLAQESDAAVRSRP